MLGVAILGLAHDTLLEGPNRSNDFGRRSVVPADAYTPEQKVSHEKMGMLIRDVAEYVGTAHEMVESRKKSDPPDQYGEYTGSRYSIFETARELALERAQDAKDKGDETAAITALQSLFAVTLIDDDVEPTCDKQIRQAVAVGMGDIVIQAAEHMHGVVSLKHGYPKSVPEVCKGTTALLTVATRKAFDDQFQHVEAVDDYPDSPAAQERLQNADTELISSDIAALAKLETNVRGNKDKGSRLSVTAVDMLSKESDEQHTDDERLDCVATALRFCTTDIQKKDLNGAFNNLRARRAAGMNRSYRQNDLMRTKLDMLLVGLAIAGERVGVKQLVSSCSQDVTPLAEVKSTQPCADNIGYSLFSLPNNITNEEKIKARALIYECHQESAQELIDALTEAGAPADAITAIISQAPNPDSALGMSSEFWRLYVECKQGEDDTPVTEVSNIFPAYIERGESLYLDRVAETVCELVRAGMNHRFISRFLIRRLDIDSANEDSGISATSVVKTMSRLGVQIASAPASLDELKKIRGMIDGVFGFKDPDQAVGLAEELYGSDAAGFISGMKELFYSKSPYNMRVELDDDMVERLRFIKTNAHGGDIFLKDIPGIEDTLRKYQIPQMKEVFDIFQQSEKLKLLVDLYGPSRVYTKLLRDTSNIGQLTQIFEGESGHALHTLLKEYLPAQEASILAGIVLNSDDPLREVARVVDFYEKVEFLQAAGVARDINFAAHFQDWQKFIESIPEGQRGEAFRKQIVSRLSLPQKSAKQNQTFYEDPSQAIRIFSELVPRQDLMEPIHQQQRGLIRNLLRSGDKLVDGVGRIIKDYPSASPAKLQNVFFDDELRDDYIDAYNAVLDKNIEQITTLQEKYKLTDPSEISADEKVLLRKLIPSIKAGMSNYRSQQQKAKVWVKEYVGQPIQALKLIEAWKARELALSRGVHDSPKDILGFVAEKGVLIYAAQALENGSTTVTLDEVEGFSQVFKHVGSRYAPRTTFEAIERMVKFRRDHRIFPDKILKQGVAQVNVGSIEFKAEVFDKGDPRGFTIGYDTGCCMTLGGASEDCIWAGYEDGRYSFFGVYDKAGRLRAQSILYVAESGGKKVLVADNIEANKGTDYSAIAEVYRQALVRITEEQGLQLDAIHVGTGSVAPGLMKSLPDASRVYPTPLAGTYSDAASQKVLWRRDQ
jgi:hypothetical protein